MLQPDDYAFHTIHITVDEEHGGPWASSPSATSTPTRSAVRHALRYFAGAELTRRCWDAVEGATW